MKFSDTFILCLAPLSPNSIAKLRNDSCYQQQSTKEEESLNDFDFGLKNELGITANDAFKTTDNNSVDELAIKRCVEATTNDYITSDKQNLTNSANPFRDFFVTNNTAGNDIELNNITSLTANSFKDSVVTAVTTGNDMELKCIASVTANPFEDSSVNDNKTANDMELKTCSSSVVSCNKRRKLLGASTKCKVCGVKLRSNKPSLNTRSLHTPLQRYSLCTPLERYFMRKYSSKHRLLPFFIRRETLHKLKCMVRHSLMHTNNYKQTEALMFLKGSISRKYDRKKK